MSNRPTIRATASLLAHVAAALVVLLALEPVLRSLALTPDEMAYSRGIALAAVLVSAVVVWALPSVLRPGAR